MRRSLVTAAALGVAFSAGLTLGSSATQTATAAVSTLQTDEQNTISVFAAASPSVVFVESTATRRNPWTMSALEVPQGSGSGFVWDAKGHIVTNFHVVQGASALTVKLQDGSSWPATVVGSDASKDLAVLSIEAPKSDLTPLVRGESSDLRVGQKVIAIGNPFGLDHTLTSGVISALGREIEAVNGRSITGVVQTDAAINPGNSGGPLLNSQGELIGVNTAIYSLSGSSAGIGFSIPVDTVSRIVPQLISDGRVRRASLGIGILGDHVAKRAGIEGVIIRTIEQQGPADQAGLRGLTRGANGNPELGDVIVAIGSHEVTDADSLFAALEAHAIGQSATVTVLRDGVRAKVTVDLGELR